jgi:hypothetical protein
MLDLQQFGVGVCTYNRRLFRLKSPANHAKITLRNLKLPTKFWTIAKHAKTLARQGVPHHPAAFFWGRLRDRRLHLQRLDSQCTYNINLLTHHTVK